MSFDINILIVEDLLTTRLLLRKTLKKLGILMWFSRKMARLPLNCSNRNLLTHNIGLAYAKYGCS